MPALTRRRDRNLPQECWRVYYGDVHAGTIMRCVGNPGAAPKWQWNCGFYPGLEPGDHQNGSAPTFEAARDAFEAAWQRLLPRLTEDDFAAYRKHRAFHEWKSLMWDCGCRVPTQELTGRSQCFCGAAIDLNTTEAHVYAAHMTPV